MRWIRPVACTFAILLALCPGNLRADQVDNPLFKAWSRFKIGSSATIGGTLNEGAVSIDITTKYTLVELAADHAIVEKQDTIVALGHTTVNPPKRETLAATAEVADVRATGQEDVQAMDRTFKCSVMQSSAASTQPGGAASPPPRLWVCDEVPGGVVKLDLQSHNDNGAPFEVTLLLRDFEAK